MVLCFFLYYYFADLSDYHCVVKLVSNFCFYKCLFGNNLLLPLVLSL